jgi:2'-aminobiphenyl-2,3-diol 1,2-dioxygenase large subunit
MAKLVGSFAVSHIVMSPQGCEADAGAVVSGMREIGRRLKSLAPDVVVVISSDHMFNINLALQPPFTVGIAESYVPFGDMDIPRDPIKGHPALARAIVAQGAEDGFDLARAEEYQPDHGVMIPLIFADARTIPLVPVLVNINTDPIPSAARCVALARSIRRAILALPGDERVVVLGTGGLSHWLCVPRHGEVSEAFDRKVIASLVAGRGADLAALGNDAILEEGGNGGIEILTWLMAAEIAGSPTAEEIFYQPMPSWFTGMGGVAFHV